MLQKTSSKNVWCDSKYIVNIFNCLSMQTIWLFYDRERLFFSGIGSDVKPLTPERPEPEL